MTTDEARAFYMDLCAKLSTGLAHAEETIAEQQREIERLRKALRKYGNHKAGCKEKSTMDARTCGLDEVLNERA